MLPFDATVSDKERDFELSEKLKAQWPGILQWAIDGCLVWQRDGLNRPDVVARATEEYFIEEDALARWIEERIERRDGFFESASVLFTDWKRWAESGGEFVGTPKRFSLNLEARGYGKGRKNKARGFVGIALRRGPVTDGDGFSDYPSRVRMNSNGKTRHHLSLGLKPTRETTGLASNHSPDGGLSTSAQSSSDVLLPEGGEPFEDETEVLAAGRDWAARNWNPDCGVSMEVFVQDWAMAALSRSRSEMEEGERHRGVA
jgi:putative DNA primase/helicase